MTASVRIAAREVRSRLYPNPRTWQAQLRLAHASRWLPRGTTSGHRSREDAVAAARRLAARRGFVIDETRIGWDDKIVESAIAVPSKIEWELRQGVHCLIAVKPYPDLQVVAHFTSEGSLRIVTGEPHTAPTIPMRIVEALAADARARGWLSKEPTDQIDQARAQKAIEAFLRHIHVSSTDCNDPIDGPRPDLVLVGALRLALNWLTPSEQSYLLISASSTNSSSPLDSILQRLGDDGKEPRKPIRPKLLRRMSEQREG